MNQLLFYQKPEPLNAARHRGLKLTAEDPDFSFAAGTNSIPLAVAEFPRAALDFPIVFAGQPDKVASPIVIVGLKSNENIFVDGKGAWLASYIPAFVRRYPFVLAEQPGSKELTVMIDVAYKGFSVERGQPIFVDNDQPSEFLKNAMKFLREFHEQAQRTREFMQELKNLDLLVSRQFQIAQAGKPVFTLRDFYVVDESRLGKLSDMQLISLGRRGYLMLIYAHLFSLANMQKNFSKLVETLKLPTQASGQ
jgi:hypothetical protein